MNPFYLQVAERANHRCEYCHAPEVVFNFPFEVEHIIPIAKQGKTDRFRGFRGNDARSVDGGGCPTRV